MELAISIPVRLGFKKCSFCIISRMKVSMRMLILLTAREEPVMKQ